MGATVHWIKIEVLLGLVLLFLQLLRVLGTQDSCSSIRFADETRRTSAREKLLKEICSEGTKHVDIDSVRRQFAIYVIVRDSFATDVVWNSGDAQDVIKDPFWVVNDLVRLNTTKYQWYKYGYPMWPLPYQAMPSYTPPEKESKNKIVGVFKKDEKWPNYGLATPIYFVANAWRNQVWNLEEFIQEEEAKQKKHKSKKHEPPSSLLDPTKFKNIGKALLETVNPARVENYSSWPFLNFTLIPMIKTSVKRYKGICPDELVMYFRYNPCDSKEGPTVSCSNLPEAAITLLTIANCRSTNVIIGYSMERNGAES